jgi:outer membrane lipoprotein SlyB
MSAATTSPRAAIEKYAVIGALGGGSGTMLSAIQAGQHLVLAATLGTLCGMLAGAAYGYARVRRS